MESRAERSPGPRARERRPRCGPGLRRVCHALPHPLVRMEGHWHMSHPPSPKPPQDPWKPASPGLRRPGAPAAGAVPAAVFIPGARARTAGRRAGSGWGDTTFREAPPRPGRPRPPPPRGPPHSRHRDPSSGRVRGPLPGAGIGWRAGLPAESDVTAVPAV